MRSENRGKTGYMLTELIRWLLLLQGLYYLVTGVWPLVSLRSFEAITGPKSDDWLVKTVGLLITVVAVVLLWEAWQHRIVPEVALLAAGSATVLLAVDIVYVIRHVIRPIYLLDALPEAFFGIAWAVAWGYGFH